MRCLDGHWQIPVMSPMTIRFLDADDESWRALLDRLPFDFYHLPEYLKLEAGRLSAKPEVAIIQRGDRLLVLPYLVRDWPSQDRTLGQDIVSPYGYPGFLVSDSVDSTDFVRESFDRLRAAWAERSICSAFIRLNPLTDASFCKAIAGDPALHPEGQTVSIDLQPPLDELRKKTRKNHQRDIRALRDSGCSAELVDLDGGLNDFVSIYEETMDRVRAKPYYYFSRDYYVRLREILSPNLAMCVARFEGRVVAAGLFTEFNGVVQYHLGGAVGSDLKKAPMKLVLDRVREWAKLRGNRVFHLGGGLGAKRDSLFNFKLGFANQVHQFHTLRIVVDPAGYRHWEHLAADERNAGDSKLRDGSFFPIYRATS